MVMVVLSAAKRCPLNPAGVDTGDRIRLAGEGEAGEHGAPAGDLYVQVQVKQHPIFEREGNNLYCEVDQLRYGGAGWRNRSTDP